MGTWGFDTAVSGPVKVEWGGPAKTIDETVEVDGDLRFDSTGVKRKGALNDVPVTGQALAHYSGRNETVRIQRVVLQMPGTNFEASGILGVNMGDPLTDMRVDLTVRDLSEFNQLLTTLDLEGEWEAWVGGDSGDAAWGDAVQRDGEGKDCEPGCEGASAGGECGVRAGYDGCSARFGGGGRGVFAGFGCGVGELDDQAWECSAECRGKDRAAEGGCRDVGVATYVWDSGMAMDAQMQLANAQVADVLQIIGQQGNIPVTGMMTVNAHASGTLNGLSGSGHVSLTNGVAYDEPYESAVAELTVHEKDIEASRVVLRAHGVQVAGNGGYDWGNEHLHAHLEGHDIQLSKFETMQRAKDGV
ncbi:MAG: hypothetical protein WDN23_21425 [Edaphobacter sp.]